MWKFALITLLAMGAAFLITVSMFFWRLRVIGSRVGSFQCALLEGDRWRAGVASYSRYSLNWHPVASLSLGPTRRFDRRRLAILGRDQLEADVGPQSMAEARCSYQGAHVRLAAENGALNGLVSWLEASPPQSLLSSGEGNP